ncbi:MAG: TadE/TadG family type IV pilus assembly protein [Paracoccaceae bacterium]
MISFLRNERGSLSIEALIAIPILFMGFAMTMVFWDAFKTITVSQKATYTVADILSREAEVDDDFLTTVYEVYDFLSHSKEPTALRITVISQAFDADTNSSDIDIEWSEGRGGLSGLTNLSSLEDRIPPMHDGEWLIIVESEQEWVPFFQVGLSDYRFFDVSITRPRFSGTLVYDNT